MVTIKLIVDMNGLVDFSSGGWGVFIGQLKRFREFGGDIKLAGMNNKIGQAFESTHFYHLFDDYKTVGDAQKAFGENAFLKRATRYQPQQKVISGVVSDAQKAQAQEVYDDTMKKPSGFDRVLKFIYSRWG